MKNSILAFVVLVCIWSCSNNREETVKNTENRTRVEVAKATLQTLSVNLRYSGTIEAFQTIPLTFETTGTVEKVNVDAGDEVKKGEILATVDIKNSQNMYEIALAKYNQAKDAYDRLKTVHDQGSLPDIKWVEMETNLEQAKSSLELSKNNLDKCFLKAPGNGVIGKRNIEPGMSAISITGSPLEIVEISKVYVKISVPENEISRLTKNLEARFTVSALNNRVFTGRVTNISPVADLIARTYEVKILVENRDLGLKPGMVCDVSLDLKSEKNITTIPYKSVTSDSEGKSYVFLVDSTNQKVVKKFVTLGNYTGSDVEVLNGLTAGETVVCAGIDKLSDNSLISL
jgi:RND family efflux transporter MFP subunit